jgi:hypothetical protein
LVGLNGFDNFTDKTLLVLVPNNKHSLRNLLPVGLEEGCIQNLAKLDDVLDESPTVDKYHIDAPESSGDDVKDIFASNKCSVNRYDK